MLLTNQTKITRFLFRHKNALMSAYHHTLQHNNFHNALAVTSSFRTRKSRCFRISVTDFRINRRFGVVVKGCLDKRAFGSSSSGNDSSGFDDYSLYKGRVVCVSNPQLLRREDLKVELDEAGENGGVFKGDCLPEKVVVAVDVDEVLGKFVSALNRFIADRYSTSHSVSEYHVYEFFKIWKCSRDEADIRVHEFFKSPYFKTGIYPIPGAKAALNKLSRFCQLSIVTSRQNVIKDHTIEWIEKHFPGLFQEIHFGNHFALHGVSRPKSEICKSLGAKVLIDDNPRYAIECAKVGIRVLLFDYENSYPWSKSESIHEHPLVTKVHNWEEVEQQLMKWVVS